MGGEVGQVWERQKGVCSHEPLVPSCLCATCLCVSQAENRKVRAKSESAPAATRHSRQLPAHCQVSFLSLCFLLLSYSFSLSLFHTHTHTHRPSLLAEERQDHRRTITHLYSQLFTQPSPDALPRMWMLLLGVTFGLLASSSSQQLKGERIVPAPGGWLFVWGFFFSFTLFLLLLPDFGTRQCCYVLPLEPCWEFKWAFMQRERRVKERSCALLLLLLLLLVEWMSGCRQQSVCYNSTDRLNVWQTPDRHKGDRRSCSLCVSYAFTYWEVNLFIGVSDDQPSF